MMLQKLKRLLPAVAIASALPLAGCPDRDGPLENAGEKVDEAAEDVEEGVDEAVDDIQEE